MLDRAREVARSRGPFTSLAMDVTRTHARAADTIRARCRAVSDSLAAEGAPTADLSALCDVMEALPGRGGELTRVAIAHDGAVLLDEVLPGAPAQDEWAYGPAPHLTPLVRAARWPSPFVLVDVDRAGADIEVVGPDGWTSETAEVEGTHDVLHKVPAGGWSHRRLQARAQDSWDRNAAEVAVEVNRVVAEVAPAAVLVDGDPYAVSAMVRGLDGATAELVTEISSGGRAQGIDEDARNAAIAAALDRRARIDRQALWEQFADAEAKQLAAAQGLSDVTTALRKGQVAVLFLHQGIPVTEPVWSGTEPLQIGTERADLSSLGIEDATRMRADAVLTRAALASGANVVMLDEDDPAPTDGLGALLRWSDQSTPHDAVPAMPGHGQPPGEGRTGD